MNIKRARGGLAVEYWERVLGRKRYRQLRWWCAAATGVGLADQIPLLAPRFAPRVADEAEVAFPDLHEARGAVHVHTTYSDGAGSYPAVIAAAAVAGLTFLLTADHATLAPVVDGWAGYHHGCLVLAGLEVRFQEGYLLGFGLPADFTAEPLEGETPRVWLDRVRAAGGWSVVALAGDPRHEWSDWTLDNFDGIEVMNLSSLARRRCNLPTVALAALRYFGRNPMSAMRLVAVRPARELAIWDRLLSRRRVMGIASVDAHARLRVGKRDLGLPRYSESFAAVQTHLLLRRPLIGCASADSDLLYAALRAGQGFMAYDCLHDARGFRWAACAGGRWALPGGTIADAPDLTFYVRSPAPRVVARLLRDGQVVATAAGPTAALPACGPGVYRLEVMLFGRRSGAYCWGARPWIFTNPIYVLPGDLSFGRMRPRAW
jgi:hypothetical protein